MRQEPPYPREERYQTWTGQGVRLEIVATELQDGRWNLAVINERGVWSIWYESFASAETAFEVARRAIEEEGVEEFVSIQEFECLDESHGYDVASAAAAEVSLPVVRRLTLP